MTQPSRPVAVRYLLVADVARLRRVKASSVYRYINLARVHRDAGRPWPSDIPIPADRDALVKGGRVWLRWPADGPIAAWIARTADRSAAGSTGPDQPSCMLRGM